MRLLLHVFAPALLVAGCATQVVRTPGMTALDRGDDVGARLLLEKEFAAGRVQSAWGLGDLAAAGRGGMAKDNIAAEGYWLAAALAGDPTGAERLRDHYRVDRRCPTDDLLSRNWATLASAHRNFVYGTIEISTAGRGMLEPMALAYRAPCEGRPIRRDVADALDHWWGRWPR